MKIREEYKVRQDAERWIASLAECGIVEK